MKIVIDIPDVSMQAYQDLYYKIHGMAAREGLFDDKEKSQRALALKAVLYVLEGVVKGTPIREENSFIAVCNSDDPITKEAVERLLDTLFVGSEDCKYYFEMTKIIKTDEVNR